MANQALLVGALLHLVIVITCAVIVKNGVDRDPREPRAATYGPSDVWMALSLGALSALGFFGAFSAWMAR